MAYVQKTRELAHLWTHKKQERARNPQNNFKFYGDTIYSYGEHFPIARHVNGAIFFTTRSRSRATAKHICHVRNSLPPNVPVFYMGCKPTCKPGGVLQYHKGKVEGSLLALNEATKRRQPKLWRELLETLAEAKRFCEYFGYSTKFCELPTDLNETLGLAANFQQKLDERAKAKQRKRDRLALLAQEKFEREELPEIVAAWRAGEEWRYKFCDTRVPTMLRITPEGIESKVETSQGVFIPVDHALRVLPLVEKLLLSGKTYRANGHTIHLGHYQLDEIDEAGTVHAGCHHIAKDEVLRLIGELKQLDPLFLTPVL